MGSITGMNAFSLNWSAAGLPYFPKLVFKISRNRNPLISSLNYLQLKYLQFKLDCYDSAKCKNIFQSIITLSCSRCLNWSAAGLPYFPKLVFKISRNRNPLIFKRLSKLQKYVSINLQSKFQKYVSLFFFIILLAPTPVSVSQSVSE